MGWWNSCCYLLVTNVHLPHCAIWGISTAPLPSGSQWGLQPDSSSTTITAGATAGSKLHLWLPSLSCSPICLPYSFQYAHLQMLLSQIHLYAKQRILCWIIIVWIINFSVDKRGFLIPPWCLHFRKIIFYSHTIKKYYLLSRADKYMQI